MSSAIAKLILRMMPLASVLGFGTSLSLIKEQLYFILVRVKYGVFLIDLGDLAPQGFGTLAAPIPHVKRNNLTRCGVRGQPDPWLVGLLLHKAPHCIGFSRALVHQYVGWTGGGSHI